MKTKKLLIPMLITLIFALLMVLSVFMTFAKEVDGGSNSVTATMFELAEAAGGFNRVLVILILSFSAIAALFALLKLPVVTIVCDVLGFGVFFLQKIDYSMRNVVPSERTEYAIAYYLFLACSVIVLAGAVWMIVEKRKWKKLASKELTP